LEEEDPRRDPTIEPFLAAASYVARHFPPNQDLRALYRHGMGGGCAESRRRYVEAVEAATGGAWRDDASTVDGDKPDFRWQPVPSPATPVYVVEVEDAESYLDLRYAHWAGETRGARTPDPSSLADTLHVGRTCPIRRLSASMLPSALALEYTVFGGESTLLDDFTRGAGYAALHPTTGEVLAYVMFELGTDVLLYSNFVVHPGWRSRSLAKRIVTSMMTLVFSTPPITKGIMFVRSSRLNVQSLYDFYGFSLLGRHWHDYYGNGETAVAMGGSLSLSLFSRRLGHNFWCLLDEEERERERVGEGEREWERVGEGSSGRLLIRPDVTFDSVLSTAVSDAEGGQRERERETERQRETWSFFASSIVFLSLLLSSELR
jgi:ribosomal protein S18 acetylase RimI-like enzyme